MGKLHSLPTLILPDFYLPVHSKTDSLSNFPKESVSTITVIPKSEKDSMAEAKAKNLKEKFQLMPA